MKPRLSKRRSLCGRPILISVMDENMGDSDKLRRQIFFIVRLPLRANGLKPFDSTVANSLNHRDAALRQAPAVAIGGGRVRLLLQFGSGGHVTRLNSKIA